MACVRLALHLAGNPSIGGDGMQVGTSWVEGAIALLDSVLVEAPANEVAASLLWLWSVRALFLTALVSPAPFYACSGPASSCSHPEPDL